MSYYTPGTGPKRGRTKNGLKIGGWIVWDFRFPVTALPGSSGSRPAKTSPICRGCTTCAVEKVGLVVKTNEPKTVAVLSQYCTDKPKA